MSALNFIAGMAQGYLDRTDKNREEERRTRMDQIALDRAERERRADERATRSVDRQERVQADLEAAAAPAAVQSGEVYQPAVDDEGNAMPANPTSGTGMVNGTRVPSMAAAAERAKAYDDPVAVRARQQQVLQRSDPVRAAQMEASNLTIEQNQLAAKKMRQAAAVSEAQGLLMKGGWSALPEIWDRYNNGYDVTVKENGKGGATLTIIGADGKPLGNKSYSDLQGFMREVSGTVDPDKWLTAEEARAEKERKFAIEERKVKVLEQQAETDARYKDGVVSVSRDKAVGAAAAAPLWDDRADAFLKARYTVKDEVTGTTSVDGNGLEFAKTVALAQAKQNGGDTTLALARAFDLDNRIREATKGDPTAMRAARQEYLRRVTTRPAPAETTEAVAAPAGETRMARIQRAAAAHGDTSYQLELDGQPRRTVTPPVPAPQATAPAAPPAPTSARTARDNSLMAQRNARERAAVDPDVRAAQAAVDSAKSGRTQTMAHIALDKLLSERYGL